VLLLGFTFLISIWLFSEHGPAYPWWCSGVSFFQHFVSGGVFIVTIPVICLQHVYYNTDRQPGCCNTVQDAAGAIAFQLITLNIFPVGSKNQPCKPGM